MNVQYMCIYTRTSQAVCSQFYYIVYYVTLHYCYYYYCDFIILLILLLLLPLIVLLYTKWYRVILSIPLVATNYATLYYTV